MGKLDVFYPCLKFSKQCIPQSFLSHGSSYCYFNPFRALSQSDTTPVYFSRHSVYSEEFFPQLCLRCPVSDFIAPSCAGVYASCCRTRRLLPIRLFSFSPAVTSHLQVSAALQKTSSNVANFHPIQVLNFLWHLLRRMPDLLFRLISYPTCASKLDDRFFECL